MNNYFKDENNKDDITLDEILEDDNLAEEEVDKMMKELDKEIAEAIENFEKEEIEKKENPPVYNRKAEVIFKEIPTNLNDGMKVNIKDAGVTIPAILDPKKCNANDILTNAKHYYISMSDFDGKTYIRNYLELDEGDNFGGAVSPLARLISQDPKIKCSNDIFNGPKVEIYVVGQTYNIEECEKGIKFVIVNDERTYDKCFILSSINGSVPKIESGKKYAFNCLLHSSGLYAYDITELNLFSDDKDEFHDACKTIEGTVKFTKQPNPKNKIFQFKILTANEELDAKIDRYSIGDDTLLCDKERYVFSYSGTDKAKVRKFEKVAISETTGIDEEKLLKKIDEKIFSLECLEKEKDCVCGLIAVELAGKPSGLIDKEDEFEFYITQERIKFRCIFDLKSNHTSKILKLDEKKEYYFDGVLIADTVYIRVVYEKNEKDKDSENITNIAFARAMAKLSNKKKAEIRRVVENGTKYDLVDTQSLPAFQSRIEMEEKNNILKEYYPGEVQQIIDITLKSPTLRTSQRDKILDTMINTMWGKKLKIRTEYNYLREKLDERFYAQDYLKDEIIKIFLSYKYKKERKGLSVLLVGGPGIGKTSMFKYAAEVAGIPFEKVPLNGTDTPYYINGTPRLYENATCGHIIEAIHKHGDRCVIMLDEVDKMTQGKEGDPMMGLYNLLDPKELFVDNLIEQGIDLSNVIFVLTANDSSVLPAPILDRVSEIFVPNYTHDEKCVIAKDYVIKDEMRKYDLGDKKIQWDENAIDDIANRYTLTDGVRDIERNVASIVRNALLLMVKEKKKEITVSQENIYELLNIVPCKREDIVHDIAALKNKFKYFKYSYSETVCDNVMALFAKYDVIKDSEEREVIRKKLDYIVNFVPDRSENNFDLVNIKEKLDTSHYGMEEVKSPVLSYIATRNVNPDACAKCLWFDGPFGTGKTTICKSIANAMNRKFIKISLNGVTTAGFLKGFEPTWKDAMAGKILEELSKAGTDKIVILLDEIDKMSNTNNGDPYSALLDLLDDSAIFTDLFVGVPVDVSNILFIATSNDSSKVPVFIQDRMELIQLHGYTEDEKKHIAEEYVVKKKLDKYMIKEEILSDETIKGIVSDYCKSYGVRDVDKTIDKVLREYIKEAQLGNMFKEIDEVFVRKILGAKPMKRGNIADEATPGVARALAVSGNAGTTFAVQVTENPFGKSDEITGLPKQSTIDSIKISKLLISKMLQKELPMLHVHFGEGGIEKDGPSAGITIFSAMYSCLTGIDIDNKTGMTGEIDVFGSVWPIGGLELKITAAENEGCTRVLVPTANYQQLMEEDKLDKYKCEIIPVSNVQEVCNLLFDDYKIKR